MKLKFAVSLLLLVIVSCQLARAKADTGQKPNVLLIAIDDLNDWVGCLDGHPQSRTPAIDALAQRGVLFANAHCQSPVCNPSRASMLTGRYPHSTGVYFLAPTYEKAPKLKDVKTIPERFADEGYEVIGGGKIFHSRGNQLFNRLGEYAGNMGGFGPRPEKKISQPHGHLLWDWGAFPDADEKMPDHKLASWAIEQLDKQHDKPFFMAIGFYRPHVPMFVPPKWFDKHPLEKVILPTVNANDCNDISKYALDLTNLKHVAPKHSWVKESGQWKHAVQSYLASTTFVDHQVGRVIAALDESKYKDNTIIVLYSDHGFHLGEKERWAKRSLWEDSTRVPMIVVDPLRNHPKVCFKPAELIDIYPTLLELTGMEPDPKQHGQSLVPIMDDPNLATWDHPAITSFGPGNFSIRSERYRYIHYNDGSEEFYDVINDPHEWQNLLAMPLDLTTAQEIALQSLRKQNLQNEHSILPGNSTGHNAYQAAETNRK